MRLSTRLIHSSKRYNCYGALAETVHRSVAYKYPSPEVAYAHGRPMKYPREGSPTVAALEELVSALEEGSWALAFSSGMAALSAVLMAVIEKGACVVAPRIMYGSSRSLLERLAAKLEFEVILTKTRTEDLVDAIDKFKPSVVFLEVVVNPTLYVFDVEQVVSHCKSMEAPCLVVVDNTIATPVLCKPLQLGVDMVVHSLTKFVAGHNDVMGGAVIGRDQRLEEEVWTWRRLLGGVMDSEQAYLIIRGAKTLEVRVRRQCKTALAIAEYLSEHPRVSRVLYPGLPSSPGYENAAKLFPKGLYGALVSFELKGGRDSVIKFLSSLKIITPSTSFGGTETVVSWPAMSSHAEMDPVERKEEGLTETLLRLSVGLEDADDIIEDLGRALKELQG